MRWIFVSYQLLLSLLCFSQTSVFGVVENNENVTIPFVKVSLLKSSNYFQTRSDEFGRFYFDSIPPGDYQLSATCINHVAQKKSIKVERGKNEFSLRLTDTSSTLSEIDIYYKSPYAVRTMRMVEGIMITNGKKTQQIDIAKIDANNAVNNARELYAKVPGLNIWESDGGGLQLGIGARGLSPSRTAHFNTRQNGYDISADALGYPESYYTPPSDALETIQLIRGAASLQFGPQFGGMINFKLKDAAKNLFIMKVHIHMVHITLLIHLTLFLVH